MVIGTDYLLSGKSAVAEVLKSDNFQINSIASVLYLHILVKPKLFMVIYRVLTRILEVIKFTATTTTTYP